MFRDPYDWVEAMRVEPHHAHDHLNYPSGKVNYTLGWRKQATPLPWKAFVTKPWFGRRGLVDEKICRTKERLDGVTCIDDYSFADIAPCSIVDTHNLTGLGTCKY